MVVGVASHCCSSLLRLPSQNVKFVTPVIQRLRGTTVRRFTSSSSSWSSSSSVHYEILEAVASGKLTPDAAVIQLQQATLTQSDSDNLVQSFAKIDHGRSKRTGFPEVVFAQGKTAEQVCAILDDMAKHNAIQESSSSSSSTRTTRDQTQDEGASSLSAILATRVTPDQFEQMMRLPPLQHGKLSYDAKSRIVTMIPNNNDTSDGTTNSPASPKQQQQQQHRVVVVTAGTTDIPVAEEAAVVLEACSGFVVDRVYDAGVAGLHRILTALPRLRHESVRCVIVCAGMDGALPSVVGGLVSTPVVAVPTSVGYGASFHGVSALLTMLNSCSPGVGVVNIDNGFGAAAWAYKMIHSSHRVAAS